MLSSADEVEEARERAKKYIRKYVIKGIKPYEIFTDTTGDKLPMSIGLFQAAEQTGVSSMYVMATRDSGLIEDPAIKEEGKPVFISDHSAEDS